jgi:hypothetical protein
MILLFSQPGIKQDPISRITTAEKGWSCGSSGSKFKLSPEFKPHIFPHPIPPKYSPAFLTLFSNQETPK